MSSAWSLERGARLGARGEALFSVWAPRAKHLAVRLAGRQPHDHPLARGENGVFEGIVDEASAGKDYLYVIDGVAARPDPVSRHQPFGVHGPSRIVDPRSFAWNDGGWRGVEMHELVVYELHVGVFTDAGSFDGAIERLATLRDLGITAVELMPVAEFPGGRNWGYDGTHPYAPHSAYGGPEGLRRFVDAAHAAGLGVILDVVYNHLGPEGNYLGEYGPYFTDRYRTPWGQAVNFDGPDSDEVRRYFVDNARYWVNEFHLDGLRLDAVHAIFDFSADHILAEIGRAVHDLASELGRRALVIAESDLDDPRIVRPAERGGLALDGQWNDDFHHAVHAALTGERSGYYVDFGGAGPVIEVLRERFVLRGCHSRYRRRRHGAPAADVPCERFVVFTQNHDQVGNRAKGERLASLVSLDAQKLSAALLVLSPYAPLLFMGQEYGETRPFLYFVSHGDPALVEAVRSGRLREFASFEWRSEVPDPQAVETFLASRLDRSCVESAGHAAILKLHRDLLALRRAERDLWRARFTVTTGGASSFAIRYGDVPGRALLAAFNLSPSLETIEIESRDDDGRWRGVLATDEVCYGGERPSLDSPESRSGRLGLSIPGHVALVYRWSR